MSHVGCLEPVVLPGRGMQGVLNDGLAVETRYHEVCALATDGKQERYLAEARYPVAAIEQIIRPVHWVLGGIRSQRWSSDHILAHLDSRRNDLDRPVSKDKAGGVGIHAEVVLITRGEPAGPRYQTHHLLRYKLHTGQGADGVGGALQQGLQGVVVSSGHNDYGMVGGGGRRP